jgi:hypothetical protein
MASNRMVNRMTNNIQAGTIMLEESVLLPRLCGRSVKAIPEAGEWSTVWTVSHDRGIRKAGWNFIFVEGRIKVVIGWRRKAKSCKTALGIVKSRWFNSAENHQRGQWVLPGYSLRCPLRALPADSAEHRAS